MLLSLDMSTRKTGYCLWKDNKIIDYGIIEPNINFESENKDDILYARIEVLYEELKKIIRDNTITECVFENVPLSYSHNIDVGKWLCVLQGILISICFEYQIKFYTFHPSEWRSKINLLQTEYTCQECGNKFIENSGKVDIICPFCQCTKKTKFKKSQLNDRHFLKKRAIETANKEFSLNLKYISKDSKKNEDDIAEAILIGKAFLEGRVD